MSDSSTTYRFDGDASGLLAELQAVRAALDASAQSAVKAGTQMDSTTKAATASMLDLSKATTSLGATGYKNINELTTSLGATGYQATAAGAAIKTTQADAAASVALTTAAVKAHGSEVTGASKAVHEFGFQTAQSKRELLVLAHELSQGNFKRFGGSLLVLAEQTGAAGLLFSAAGLTALALTGAVAGVALAYYRAYEDQENFKKSLILTNNAAGLTASTYRELAQSIADSSHGGISTGKASEAVQAVASTGRFNPTSIVEVSTAVATVAKLTDQAAADVVKDFEKMADGVAKWATEHNKQYHYLTAAQLDYIRELESQGKAQEAAAFNSRLLDDQLNRNRKTLEGLPGVLASAAAGWERLGVAYRAATGQDTTAEKIDQARRELDGLLQQQERAAADPRLYSGNRDLEKRLPALIAAKRAEIGVLQSSYEQENAKAKEQAAEDAKNQKEIELRSAAHVKALESIDIASFNRRAEVAAVARAQMQIGIDDSYRQGVLTLDGYERIKYNIEKGAILDKIALINLEIAANQRSVVGTPEEKLARDARQIELDTKRIALQKETLALNEKLKLQQLGPAKPETFEVNTPQQDFTKFERAQQASVEKAIEDRRTQALSGASSLLVTNEKLNASLILDDEKRARAELDIEERELRARTDLGALSADERKAVESEFANWRVLKEREITERLKPEWQRRLDLWADTNRLMKESFDSFVTGWQDAGQAAWTEFLKTGKVNIKNITTFALEEFAKLSFQKTLGAAWTDLGKTVAGWLGFGTGISKTAGTVDPTGATVAQTAAIDSSTVSLQAFIAAVDAAIGSLNSLSASSAGAGASSAGSAGGGWLGTIGSLLGSWFGGGLSIDSSGYSATGGAGYASGAGISGGRASGGPTPKGSMWEVAEQGPELLRAGGKTYLMMGAQDGMVTPATRAQAGSASAAAASTPAPAASGPNVILNVQHKGDTQPKVTQTSRQTDQGTIVDLVIDTMVNDMNGGGRFHDATARRFGLSAGGAMPRVG